MSVFTQVTSVIGLTLGTGVTTVTGGVSWAMRLGVSGNDEPVNLGMAIQAERHLLLQCEAEFESYGAALNDDCIAAWEAAHASASASVQTVMKKLVNVLPKDKSAKLSTESVRHLDDASRGMRRVIEPVKKGRLSLWPFSRKQDQTTLQDDFAAADSEHEDILAEPRQLLQHDAVKAAFENPATVSAMMQALWSQGRGAEMLKMFQQAQDRVAKVSAYNKILADPAARMALAWFKRQEAKFWDSGTPVPLLVLQSREILCESFRKADDPEPSTNFHSLYRSVSRGAKEHESVYLETTTAADPKLSTNLDKLPELVTFCESDEPLPTRRGRSDLAYPLGYHYRRGSVFVLYLSHEEEDGQYISGHTLGDQLKRPEWLTEDFKIFRVEVATRLALLYVQCHTMMENSLLFPSLETFVYVLPQSMHDRTVTDLSGELEDRLCWKLALGKESRKKSGILVRHRPAHEIAVLWAVLTGKDCLKACDSSVEALAKVQARLSQDFAEKTSQTAGKLEAKMRRLLRDALLSPKAPVSGVEELQIKQDFYAALLEIKGECMKGRADYSIAEEELEEQLAEQRRITESAVPQLHEPSSNAGGAGQQRLIGYGEDVELNRLSFDIGDMSLSDDRADQSSNWEWNDPGRMV